MEFLEVTRMDYVVFRLGDGETVDALEVHVFARAYIDAWRALYLCEPTGEHTVESLGLTIDFGRRVRRMQ